MIATSIVTAAILPVYGWLSSWGITGLAMAGSLGMSLQVLTLAWLARQRLGLDLGALGQGILRALPVAALAAAAAWSVEHWIPAHLTQLAPMLRYGVRLGLAGGAWVVIVVGVGTVVGMPGLSRVMTRIRGKLGRA